MNTEVMFSSKSDDWYTPNDLFDELNKTHNFKVDVCASYDNAKVNPYFDKKIDGLSMDWVGYGSCWMNPPYGREIGKWIKKAHDESQKGCKVVCLLPARTDTKWFHEYIYKKDYVSIEFLKGRLKFGGHKDPAPFPSMIVIFTEEKFSMF